MVHSDGFPKLIEMNFMSAGMLGFTRKFTEFIQIGADKREREREKERELESVSDKGEQTTRKELVAPDVFKFKKLLLKAQETFKEFYWDKNKNKEGNPLNNSKLEEVMIISSEEANVNDQQEFVQHSNNMRRMTIEQLFEDYSFEQNFLRNKVTNSVV